jgi:hypothetical protein
MTQRFSAARPTFDFNGLGDFFSKWIVASPAGTGVGEWVAEQARGFAEQIIKARLARAGRTAAILSDPARVLTHCNVSGELVAIAQYCRSMGKKSPSLPQGPALSAGDRGSQLGNWHKQASRYL